MESLGDFFFGHLSNLYPLYLNPFLNVGYSERKEFAPKFICLRVAPIKKGGNYFYVSVISLEDVSLPFK